MESFVAGFAYGATTVCVGQPLDTLKTLQQASVSSSSASNAKKSMVFLARELYQGGGVRAFYRGGGALLLGGGLMRSAQFGVYQTVLSWNPPPSKRTSSSSSMFVNPHVVVAGFCGGIGRGLVEGPFEMVKVRRQVVTPWTVQEIGKGFGTTLVRNAFLFASFAVYMDIYDHYSFFGNDDANNPAAGSPFLKGGLCANLAWLTIWPLDVVKSRLQSGHYPGKSPWAILQDAIRDGHLYRGLVPGLTRSFIANGCSMVVYKHVEQSLLDRRSPQK